MRKAFLFILFFCCLLWIYISQGCKKNPLQDGIAKGRVLEYGTLKPIEGAIVHRKECIGEFGGGAFCSTVDSVLTDAGGNYYMEWIPKENEGLFELYAEKPGYYTADAGTAWAPSAHVTHDFTLNAPAWIHLRIKNINPINASDFIKIKSSPSIGPYPEYYFGTNIDFLALLETHSGNSHVFFNCTVIKSGAEISFRDSVYCPILDTAFHEILY